MISLKLYLNLNLVRGIFALFCDHGSIDYRFPIGMALSFVEIVKIHLGVIRDHQPPTPTGNFPQQLCRVPGSIPPIHLNVQNFLQHQ